MAWKAGGKQWKAWSWRLVTATLLSGRANSDPIHILSCYAPTFSASRADKNKFLDELQQALDAIPPSECYVIIGDFNARVGSRVSVNDQWANVHGPHGLGDRDIQCWTQTINLPFHQWGNSMQHLVSQVDDTQAHLAALPALQVKEVLLHWFCQCAAKRPEKVPWCMCYTRCRVQHQSPTPLHQD